MNKLIKIEDIFIFDLPEKHTAMLGHLPFLRFLMMILNKVNYLELGVHWGQTLFNLAQFAGHKKMEGIFIGVDNFQGDQHSGFFDSEVFEYCERKAFECKNVKIIKNNFDKAINNFENEYFDLVLLDGLHLRENIENEFNLILPKMKKNGIVLLHDINETKNGFTTYIYWEEIKKKYRTLEFKHSHGLGIVFLSKNGSTPQFFNSLINHELFYYFDKIGYFYEDVEKLKQYELAFNDCNEKLGRLQLELFNLSDINKNNLEILNSIINSKSWKITSPLRKIRHAFPKS